ncbi:MAG: adenylate/guanylate cyclase domain-containing protein [Alphaproteobacteria bacterium]|nr:adenylate/guanylate cyclase domain-containing protein [Alphaproteobacteria bacterium]
MTDRPIQRRLTSILCADVTGYSRLMGEDEEATLATLTDHRRTIDALIERHYGRIVSTAGDSVLAEFASIVEAVQCAVDIQHELKAKNEALPASRRMLFRIGVNLGDVMVRENDLFGDGVNLAARLQEVAEPGGICISGAVYDQVRNKLSVSFDYLGPRTVKNFSNEVPIYRLRLGTESPTGQPAATAAPPPAAVAERHLDQERRVRALLRQAMIMGVVMVFLFVLNMVTNSRSWWWYWPVLGMSMFLAMRAINVFVFPDHDRRSRKRRRREKADGEDEQVPGLPPFPPPPPPPPRR